MVQQININSPLYPSLLKNIYDPPSRLYVLGDLPKGKYVAVVGTRHITVKGEEITSKIVKKLVKSGFIIVSGLALGVDTVAHKTALECGGKTVAVLGAGLDIIYPPQNKRLYEEIIKHDGAIISEILPGHLVPKEKFAARNRIVSGMSEFVVIPQANLKSGSMVTARLALDQGKEIYCFSGSCGCDYLIEMGAKKINYDGQQLNEQ